MVDNLVVHEQLANSDNNVMTFEFFCDVSMTYWKEPIMILGEVTLYKKYMIMKNELGLIDWQKMFLSKNAVSFLK